MNELITITELSKIWGISRRRIQVLCSEGRIPNAKKIGSIWIIESNNIEKPKDLRIKSGKYINWKYKK